MKRIFCRDRKRGASVVESSLTLTVFLLILFSIFDFGYVLFLHQTIVNQARAAARYGALNPGDLVGIRNYVLYNRPTGTGTGVLGLTSANVSATRTGKGTVADRINVNVSNYGFTFLTFVRAGKYKGKPITVSMPVEAD